MRAHGSESVKSVHASMHAHTHAWTRVRRQSMHGALARAAPCTYNSIMHARTNTCVPCDRHPH